MVAGVSLRNRAMSLELAKVGAVSCMCLKIIEELEKKQAGD